MQRGEVMVNSRSNYTAHSRMGVKHSANISGSQECIQHTSRRWSEHGWLLFPGRSTWSGSTHRKTRPASTRSPGRPPFSAGDCCGYMAAAATGSESCRPYPSTPRMMPGRSSGQSCGSGLHRAQRSACSSGPEPGHQRPNRHAASAAAYGHSLAYLCPDGHADARHLHCWNRTGLSRGRTSERMRCAAGCTDQA